MFRSKTILPLFPSNVWVHDLEPAVYEPMNERLLERIEALLSPRAEIAPGYTWQTPNDLQHDPAFAELMACFRQAVDGILAHLQVQPLPYEITGAWANVNPPGSPHSPHTHPNNYLSCAYYVRTDSTSNSITFFDPRERAAMITPKFTRPTKDNSLSVDVEARVGRLAVFPSWLRHSVVPNQGEEERVSVAMNMMFSDFTKVVSPPQWG